MRPAAIGFLVAVASATPACTTDLQCPVTVDDYCASTSAPACTYRDFENALYAWNAAARAVTPPSAMIFSCGQCGGYDLLSEDDAQTRTGMTRYFARGSGALAVIVSSSDNRATCVAGPPRFSVPSCAAGGRCGEGQPPDAAPAD